MASAVQVLELHRHIRKIFDLNETLPRYKIKEMSSYANWH